MFQEFRYSFQRWTSQVGDYVSTEVVDLDPMQYGLLATFTIVIGYLMLNGRQ